MKNGSWPNGVTGAAASHSTCTRPAKVSAIADHAAQLPVVHPQGEPPDLSVLCSCRPNLPIQPRRAITQLPDLGPFLSVALAYRQLWRVEAIFRTAKSILETRPIYHQSDAAIAGHLFCSFLALLLRKDLDERLAAAGVTAEWADIVRDLDRVEQITIEQSTKRYVLRPQAPGCAGSLFQALGVALPPLFRQLPTKTPPPNAASMPPPKRRGRPRRGATPP